MDTFKKYLLFKAEKNCFISRTRKYIICEVVLLTTSTILASLYNKPKIYITWLCFCIYRYVYLYKIRQNIEYLDNTPDDYEYINLQY